VYRILIAYTSIHSNCRVGAYLSPKGYSEFYSLQQIIPNFDMFSEVAEKKHSILNDIYTESFKVTFGATFYEQIEEVWKLERPILFEYIPKSMVNEIIGYNFKSAFSVKINPSDIKALSGDSIRSFCIKIKDYSLIIRFNKYISID
jgi:hypothetical protein